MDYHTSMVSTLSVCVKHGIAFGTELIAGNQFIDLARNALVQTFLKGDYTDLIFIDADQGWDANVVPRIINDDHAVVVALPPKKTEKPSYHSNAMTGVIENGLFQSLEGGCGFMRIKREVFGRMDEAFPELKSMMEQPFGWPDIPYFQSGNTKYGRLGEDIFFCRQLCVMGEFVWIDSDVDFTHRGSRLWRGNFYEHCVKTGLLKAG